MENTIDDFKLASAAAGFTGGFGLLCTWNAIQQTRAVRRPLRSAFIWMVWGEIVANLAIGVLGWLFLDGILKASVPVLFSLLFMWVFEIQFLMQIIINRISVVLDDHRLIRKIKWGTAFIITLINIAVFIIWIPAHLSPPPIPILFTVNNYWDPTSKVIILLVDAALNYFFLRTVKLRLVKYHGLAKYAALVRFNARLMVLSISMDLILILLMFLHNKVVYIQFHPVTYMVKLNIELSMASLITKIAKSTVDERNNELGIYHTSSHLTSSSTPYSPFPKTPNQSRFQERCLSPGLAKVMKVKPGSDEGLGKRSESTDERGSDESVRASQKSPAIQVEDMKEWRKERKERRKGSIGNIRWEEATRERLKEDPGGEVPATPKLGPK